MNCWFCERDVTEYPSVLVDFEGLPAEVCTDCLEKADTDEPAPPVRDREGDPYFNGSFAA